MWGLGTPVLSDEGVALIGMIICGWGAGTYCRAPAFAPLATENYVGMPPRGKLATLVQMAAGAGIAGLPWIEPSVLA